jgi:hypothetical protein
MYDAIERWALRLAGICVAIEVCILAYIVVWAII